MNFVYKYYEYIMLTITALSIVMAFLSLFNDNVCNTIFDCSIMLALLINCLAHGREHFFHDAKVYKAKAKAANRAEKQSKKQ